MQWCDTDTALAHTILSSLDQNLCQYIKYQDSSQIIILCCPRTVPYEAMSDPMEDTTVSGILPLLPDFQPALGCGMLDCFT